MIDRALGFTTPESYYFQLYPVNLILLQEPVPSTESKFKFSIYKGMQKFDENKIMTDSNFIETNGSHVMPFRGCQLNFYVPNFNANRKTLFTLKLTEKQGNEEYELGGIDIDPATYIAQFKEKGQNRFQEKIEISDQYAIEFEMYLEKSRFALEKIVKSFKTERTMKSPVRERKSPVRERKSPDEGKSAVSESKSPVSENRFSRTQEKEADTVQEPAVEKSISKSKVVEKPTPKAKVEQKPQVQEPPTEVVEEKVEEKPVKKTLQPERKPETRERSQKSETIVSPVVKTKQMKRTSGRNQSTIRSSQRLVKEPVQEPTTKVAVDNDSWTNHLQLVGFTLIGILLIYWVMHPNSKV